MLQQTPRRNSVVLHYASFHTSFNSSGPSDVWRLNDDPAMIAPTKRNLQLVFQAVVCFVVNASVHLEPDDVPLHWVTPFHANRSLKLTTIVTSHIRTKESTNFHTKSGLKWYLSRFSRPKSSILSPSKKGGAPLIAVITGGWNFLSSTHTRSQKNEFQHATFM